MAEQCKKMKTIEIIFGLLLILIIFLSGCIIPPTPSQTYFIANNFCCKSDSTKCINLYNWYSNNNIKIEVKGYPPSQEIQDYIVRVFSEVENNKIGFCRRPSIIYWGSEAERGGFMPTMDCPQRVCYNTPCFFTGSCDKFCIEFYSSGACKNYDSSQCKSYNFVYSDVIRINTGVGVFRTEAVVKKEIAHEIGHMIQLAVKEPLTDCTFDKYYIHFPTELENCKLDNCFVDTDSYFKNNYKEDFAETFAWYIVNANSFRIRIEQVGGYNSILGQKYLWIKTNIFNGKEM